MAIGVYGADDPNQAPAFRDPVVLREQVLFQLRKIIDPDLFQDIVTLGFIKKLEIEYEPGRVSFTLELTTPACPVKDQFVEEATTLLKDLGWVNDVDITLSSRKAEGAHRDSTAHLMGVGSIICVASCKGGVGKSSVAVNLAFMLKRLGASVGLVDADVYGPSLPQLVPVEGASVFFRSTEEEAKKTTQLVYEGTGPITKAADAEETAPALPEQSAVEKKKQLLASGKGGLVPVEHSGVKLMSAGYLRSSAEYAAVRGPLASGLAYQMVAQTFWGSLDYLIIDMPPGTGDVHLTIAQSVRITAAIMVTTPQQLSLTDVEKGIHMFNKLDIPTIAIVENMTYFACPNCHVRSAIFNTNEEACVDGLATNSTENDSKPQQELKTSRAPKADSTAYRNIDRLIQQFGVQYHIQFPLHPDLSRLRFPQATDPTKFDYPFTLAFDTKHFVWVEYKRLAELLAREVSSLKFAGDRAPDLRVIGDGTLQVVIRSKKTSHASTGVVETIMHIPVREVRLACRCAECVDEYNGTVKLQARKVPIDVHPKTMHQSGTYAVSIDWSDKHNSLISFTLLEELCKQYESREKSAADKAKVGCGADEQLEW